MSESSRQLQKMLKPPHASTPTLLDASCIQRLFCIRKHEAKEKGLSHSLWLALMTAIVIGVDCEVSMAALYHQATESMDLEGSIAVAELMREIGLRGIAVVSLPQIMDILAAFRASLSPAVRSSLGTTPLDCVNADNIEFINEQGRSLWDAIHHPKGSFIERKLANAHPNLANYVKNHVYGGLLARHGGITVGRVMTSLCAIACLRASRPFSLQLVGHIHGLKKSWKDGSWRSDPDAGSEEGMRWLTSDEGCIWVLEVVDELVVEIKTRRAAHPVVKASRL